VRGLDVHEQTVVACLRVTTAGLAQHAVRTFATTATGLRTLQAWLVAAGCTHAVMESTGDYWKSVWHRLEDSLTLVLAIATAVRNLPGHKSDVSDAQWLADLLAHGLVRGSFVPPAPIQALRELTRLRKQLGREVTAHSQRIEKVLESADVKLAAVLRPLLGVSGRAIIAAPGGGRTRSRPPGRVGPPTAGARRWPRCGPRCPDRSGRIIASCCASTCGWSRRCSDDRRAGRRDRGGPRAISRRCGSTS
jgi:transposase